MASASVNRQNSSASYLSSNVRQLLRFAVEPCRDKHLNNQALQCLRKELYQFLNAHNGLV